MKVALCDFFLFVFWFVFLQSGRTPLHAASAAAAKFLTRVSSIRSFMM